MDTLKNDESFINGWINLEEGFYREAVLDFYLSGITGNPISFYEMAGIFEYQYADYAEACKWYRRAIENLDPDAMMALALFSEDDKCGSKDKARVVYFLKRAAEGGDDRAMFKLFMIFHFGEGVQKNEGMALHYLLEAAKNGRTSAMRVLGEFYLKGTNELKQNFGNAIYWHEKAARRKIVEDTIADLYFFGDHCRSRDFDWKYDPDNKRYTLDDRIIALIELDLFDKDNPYQDIPNAIYWYKEAASESKPSAMRKLAYLHENGFYVEQDLGESGYWYEQAMKLDKTG